MSSLDSRSAQPVDGQPTLWGLKPADLHDRYWAARGVFVVRPGEHMPIPEDAELYLLADPRTLVLFRMGKLIETLTWVKPLILFVRVHDSQDHYRETVVTDEGGEFIRFQRSYGGMGQRLVRVAITSNHAVAMKWQMSSFESSSDGMLPWKQLRRATRTACRETATVYGGAYNRTDDFDVARFVRDLVQSWREPSATLPHIRCLAPGVWGCGDLKLDPSVRFVGGAWIGAGRVIQPGTSVLGPAALWDDPACRPAVGAVEWSRLQPTAPLLQRREEIVRLPNKPLHRFTKRVFDIVFSLIGLAFTLPFYPLIMLAIWLEDGRPFFFVHRRETIGGRDFPCIKFRSMRKNAELNKTQLKRENLADGPQFYMPADPRVTRVGRTIRRCNIDETPQFINVLLGHMSIIGPRPSPFSENQCCPAWREARLSVRPGITGLWQVMRTRQPGLDFQEWIRYDLEYVEHGCWGLDLRIIFKTIRVVFHELIGKLCEH